MTKDNLICVGELTSAHGVKGLMKLRSFTEVPDDIFEYGDFYKSNEEQIKITKKGVLNNASFIVEVQGVNGRNEAEVMRGTEIFVDRSVFSELDEEEGFYREDLVGLEVRDDKTGDIMGKVKHVHNYGASDILELELNKKTLVENFPFTHEIFPQVNMEEGYITFIEPEYLEGKQN